MSTHYDSSHIKETVQADTRDNFADFLELLEGILNHNSPSFALKPKKQLNKEFYNSIKSRRDWRDYVNEIWLINLRKKDQDLVTISKENTTHLSLVSWKVSLNGLLFGTEGTWNP